MAPGDAAAMVTDVVHREGEYSFTLRGGAGEQAIHFWGDIPAPANPRFEPALASSLLPAMTVGGTLSFPGLLSAQLLRLMPEIQGQLVHLTAVNALVGRQLYPVEILGGGLAMRRPSAAPGVAGFFSGGLDSWSMLLADPTITELIYVHGFDIPIDRPEVSETVEARLGEAAERLGKPLRVIRTNLRAVTDPMVGWEIAHGPGLAAVALLLASACGRVLIGSSAPYSAPAPRGSTPSHDHLWSTEECRIEHRGAHLTRPAKIEQVSTYQPALDVLRVCWHEVEKYNCAHCEKCLLTMCSLEAIGVLDRTPTFAVPLDYGAVAGMRFADPELVNRAQEILDVALARGGRSELIEALQLCVAANRPTNERLVSAEEEIARLQRELEVLYSSRSWRLTKPLRRLRKCVRPRSG